MATLPWTSRWVYAVTADTLGNGRNEPFASEYETKARALLALRTSSLPSTLWRKRAGSVGGWEIVQRRAPK